MCCVDLRFDRLVKTKYPANVLSGFEAEAGATFFNLNELQVRCGATAVLHVDALLCMTASAGWTVSSQLAPVDPNRQAFSTLHRPGMQRDCVAFAKFVSVVACVVFCRMSTRTLQVLSSLQVSLAVTIRVSQWSSTVYCV